MSLHLKANGVTLKETLSKYVNKKYIIMINGVKWEKISTAARSRWKKAHERGNNFPGSM